MDFFSEVERQLDLPPDEKAQVIRELESHYLEIKDELIATGTDPAHAEQEAARRLGDPGEIAVRMQQVHCRATWKSAFLAAAPIQAPALLAMLVHGAHGMHLLTLNALGITAMLLQAGLFGGVAIRELVLGRRPVWLPTWLAGGLVALAGLAWALGPPGPPYSMVVALVSTALPIAVALLLCWKSPKWRAAAIGVPVATALFLGVRGGVIIRSPLFWGSISSVLHAAVWTLIALRVFAAHRHGNAPQASLFLFAYFFAYFAPVVWGGPYPAFLLYLLLWLLPVAAVVVYARASTWRNKIVALAAAIVLSGIYSMWEASGVRLFAVFTTLVWVGLVVLRCVV